MLKTAYLLCPAALALAGTWYCKSSTAARVTNEVPAIITFQNWAGDRILGDGRAYTDGVDGVSCVVHNSDLGGSGDCIIDTRSSHPSRTVHFQMLDVVPPPAPCTGIPPNPSLTYDLQQEIWLNVSHLWQLKNVGDAAYRPAYFLLPRDSLRFGTFPGQTDYCASPVYVVRTGPDTWDVSSPPNGVPGGSTAVFLPVQNGRSVPVNYYAMPFHLTVQLKPQP
jgi:hypothetical protein